MIYGSLFYGDGYVDIWKDAKLNLFSPIVAY